MAQATGLKRQVALPRLVDVQLYPLAEGRTLAVSPKGQLLEIATGLEVVSAVVDACDVVPPSMNPEELPLGPAELRALLDGLVEEGCLAYGGPVSHERAWAHHSVAPATPDKLPDTTAHLVGHADLLSLLRDTPLLTRFGAVTDGTMTTLNERLHEGPASQVVLSAHLQFDRDLFLHLDRMCEAHNVPWLPFYLDNGRAWIGPAIVPGRTVNYRDVVVRRKCAAEYLDVERARMQGAAREPYVPPGAELIWLLSTYAAEAERFIAGATCQSLSAELEADPVSRTIKWYSVLPLPDRVLDGEFATSASSDWWQLVNPRNGVILRYREIAHHPSIPTGLCTVQTDVANMSRHYNWANNTVCGGSGFDGFEAARNAAIGEAVERYCGNIVPTADLVQGSFDELTAQGVSALDPLSLVGYSDAQYASPGFPFVPFDRSLQVKWAAGQRLSDQQPTLVPASLVYVNWFTGGFKDEPPTNYMYYPGIAAGPTLDYALASAIEEVLERHVTMCWWTNAQALPSVQMPADLQEIWRGAPEQHGQRAWLIHLDNPFGIPVMAGVVENTHEQLLNIGFAVRADPRTAALKAWSEALTLQEGSRDLLLEDGLLRQAIAYEDFDGEALKPWREDRHYLDSFRRDLRDVSDLMCQQQVHLDPRAHEAIRPIIDTPTTRAFQDLPSLPDRDLATYMAILAEHGLEAYFVDITTSDVRLSGLHVVRVIIPGLVPNFPAAFPFLGKEAIQRYAVDMGWADTLPTEQDLNLFPLPHA